MHLDILNAYLCILAKHWVFHININPKIMIIDYSINNYNY
jgi:hypothetical protein